MKRLFLLCLILVVMAAAISGLHGCTSAGFDYYSGSGKDYPTYDYQGNRLEQNEGESHQNRGY
jgi:hypothetical protein